MNRYIINKFGGGVLKKDLMPYIEKRIKEQIKHGHMPVVIVSALPSITDKILNIIKEIKQNKKNIILIQKFINKITQIHFERLREVIKNKNDLSIAEKSILDLVQELKKELNLFIKIKEEKKEDLLVSFGEKFSAIIFHHFLNSLEIKNREIFAEEIPIITDSNFKNANILYNESSKNLKKIFKNYHNVLIIPGFTGKNKKGDITVLGRGGTDTTACFVGSALNAKKIILWKNVGGVLSADPKIVYKPKTIPFINHQEAEEAGKIIHEKAIKYLKINNTPIEISSITNKEEKTIIKETSSKNKLGAKLVSYKENLIYFKITDEYKKENYVLDKASAIFAKNQVDIILISNTKYILQIVADNQNEKAKEVLKELEKIFEKVEIHSVYMVFLIGNFNLKMVHKFNEFLIKNHLDMEISAFLYKNCKRIEAIIHHRKNKENELENIIIKLHKKFIR